MVAACANGFERGDMAAVASTDATIIERQATLLAARHHKKERKAAVAAKMRDYAFKDSTPDTLSDDELS